MSQDNALRVITQFLSERTVAGLATADVDGRPHAANVVYACDPAGHVFFLSGEGSRHVTDVTRTGSAAISVYAHDGPVAGVQASGPCRELPRGASAHAAAVEFYLERLGSLPGESLRRERVGSEPLFCLRIDWARILDSSHTPPIVEWTR